MKKLFIAAMALATIVSCSKDDAEGGIALDSTKKSVAITIANGNGGTRVAGDDVSAGTTAGNSGQTAVTCEAAELDILFADAGGKIMNVLPLTTQASEDSHDNTTGEYAVGKATEENTYVWHNVPAAVTQVAVVRNVNDEITITPGTTELKDVEAYAFNEQLNLQRPITEVFLYKAATLQETSEHAVVVDGTTYYFWKASIVVKPEFARVELTQIACTDLGYKNTAKEGDASTVSLDKLVVNSLTWNSDKKTGYKIDATPVGTMYGQYVSTTNTDAQATDLTIYANETETTPGTTVWSWNVLPCNFVQMDLAITGTAWDYQVADEDIALKVIGLASKEDATTPDKNKFEAGNIYRIPLNFTEGDLTGQEGKCVKVDVTIVDWVVNTVYPVFGN